MVSFTVNVDPDRADEFIELLRVNNFTDSTVQLPVFPQADPPPSREEEDIKLFNSDGYDGYLEDDMTRITRRQLEKEEAERLAAVREEKQVFTKRNSRKKAFKAGPARRKNIPAQEEEVMEDFVIMDAGSLEKAEEGGDHNTDELMPPLRKRRVTVKLEIFTPPSSPVRLRRGTRNTDDSLPTASHDTNDSCGDLDHQEDVEMKPYIPNSDRSTIVCRLCGNKGRRSRPRQMYHVMSFHTKERSLKCPHCPFEAARKPALMVHLTKLHASYDDPIDIVTDAKREIWDSMMKRCFPEYADDTGFYKERVTTY